jgi:Protein of unknown function (DUF3102)
MTNTALTPQALSPIVAAQDLTEAELVKGIKTALSQMASSFRQSVKSAIEAGEMLREAKARRRGDFGSWLEDNFKLSRATATRYMKLAEHRQDIERELLTMSNYTLADAYKLIGVSKPNPTSNDSANNDDGDGDGASAVITSLSAVMTSEEKLLKALKALKAADEGKAKEAASKVVQRLADADLIAAS